MVKINSLPTFTYTKPIRAGARTRSGKQYFLAEVATSQYRGKTIYPRCASRNVIDRRKWRAAEPPPYWPKTLIWPNDIAKALLYDLSPPRKQKVINVNPTTKPTNQQASRLAYRLPPCSSTTCPTPRLKSRNPADLCTCTTAPWDRHATPTWPSQNIALHHSSPQTGIGVRALTCFSPGTILGEYTGELLPFNAPYCTLNSSQDGAYIFDLTAWGSSGGGGVMLSSLDALRVGNWTRFMNHSCAANASFVYKRVGGTVRVCVEVMRCIEVGEEVSVDYGSGYWVGMRERGRFCCCGEVGCKYAEKKKGRG